jgi:hypothetical protein
VITLPNVYPSDVLKQNQLILLAEMLPVQSARTGRPSYTNLHCYRVFCDVFALVVASATSTFPATQAVLLIGEDFDFGVRNPRAL